MRMIRTFKKKYVVMENEEAKRFVFGVGRNYDTVIRLIGIAKTLDGELRDEMLDIICEECKTKSNDMTRTLEKLF